MAKTASKSFWLSSSSQKLLFFTVLLYSLYGHPKYSKLKRKYQKIRLEFPDYLSVSYDYDSRNVDEYVHFYGTAGQNVKNEGNIYKNLDNYMP